MKRLQDLYEKDSMHKGMFARGWAELKKRAAVQAYPDRPPEAKVKAAPGPIPHPTDSSPSKDDSGLSMKGAVIGGALGGLVAGPWGAAAGAIYGMSRKKK